MLKSIESLKEIVAVASSLSPLLEGNEGEKNLNFGSREIYNRLIDWIQNKFSDDIALQFKNATVGTKIPYTTDDTDLTAALKTVLNLISQIHSANPLNKGATRHLQWPLYEVLELARNQDLLKSIFLEKDWQSTLTLFSNYWVGLDNFINKNFRNNPHQQEEFKLAKVQSVIQDEAQESLARFGDLSLRYIHTETNFQRIYLIIKMYMNRPSTDLVTDQSEPIKNLTGLLCEMFVCLDYLEARIGAPGLFSKELTEKLMSLLNARSNNAFIQVLRRNMDVRDNQFFVGERLRKSLKRIRTLDASIALETMPETVTRFFKICTQIQAQAGFSKEDAIFMGEPKNHKAIKSYLKRIKFPLSKTSVDHLLNLTQESFQRLLTDEKASQHKELLTDFISYYTLKINSLRGLKATRTNIAHHFQRLRARNKSNSRLVYLHIALANAEGAVKNLMARLESAPQNLANLLHLLGNNLQAMRELVNYPDKAVELAARYQGMERIYAKLTAAIPLTSRRYLQENIQKIRNAIQHKQKNSPIFLEACQHSSQSVVNAHRKAVLVHLSTLDVKAENLMAKIGEVDSVSPPTLVETVTGTITGAFSKVAQYYPFMAKSEDKSVPPIINEKKADTLDYLECLRINIKKLQIIMGDVSSSAETKTKAINAVAKNIFNLRFLAQETSLPAHPVLMQTWKELDQQIDYLREREPIFARAIAAPTPQTVIEDAQWCKRLGLAEHLPSLSAPAPRQVLKSVHDLTATIHERLNKIFENQPKGSWYHTLYQTQWQKFSFNDQDTTETYTLKLFLNLLFQIYEATDSKITSWIPHGEWIKRFAKLPIQEISGLMDELPVFIVHSGICDLVGESIGLVKTFIGNVTGQSQSPGITDVLIKSDDPTASPFHALGYSGLISDELPKVLNMVAGVGRLTRTLQRLHKKENEFKPKLEEKPYHQLPAQGSRVIHFGRNAGIFLSNKVSRRISNLKIWKDNFNSVSTEYREIAKDAISIAKSTTKNAESVKKALAETGRHLHTVLVRLDSLVVTTGLVEHKALVKKYSEKVLIKAEADVNSTLNTQWKIVGHQPFLIERIAAQQTQLREAKTKMTKISQEIPQPVRQFIAVMKNSSISEIEQKNFNDNRESILQFLRSYIQQRMDRCHYTLKLLADQHERELQKMVESEESKYQVRKSCANLVRQHESMKEKLRGLFTLRVDQAETLFDDVLNVGTSELFSFSKFSQRQIQGLAVGLSKHVATHDRSVRSMDHYIDNLTRELNSKQTSLEEKLRHDCDKLYSQFLHIKGTAQLHPMQIPVFTANFLQFSEVYGRVQTQDVYINDLKLRHDVKFLCDAIRELTAVNVKVSQSAQEISRREVEFAGQKLIKTLSELEVLPASLLQMVGSMAVSDRNIDPIVFAEQAAKLLIEQPQLRKSFQEFTAMFSGLEFAISTALRQLKSQEKPALAAANPHLLMSDKRGHATSAPDCARVIIKSSVFAKTWI